VLTIGNILNGGTQKGQADGFNLDILSKLNSIKDSSNKNLVQYICTKIKAEDENFDGIKKQFPSLTEAGKSNFNETNSNLNKLKKELKEQNENLKKIASIGDKFYEKSKGIYDKFGSQVLVVEKDLSENLKSFQQTAQFFGYSTTDSKYKNPEEFFSLISAFLDDVEKFTPKTEPKKNFKAKHDIGKKVVTNMDQVLKEIKSRSNL
jgi:hypothetical protein